MGANPSRLRPRFGSFIAVAISSNRMERPRRVVLERIVIQYPTLLLFGPYHDLQCTMHHARCTSCGLRFEVV